MTNAPVGALIEAFRHYTAEDHQDTYARLRPRLEDAHFPVILQMYVELFADTILKGKTPPEALSIVLTSMFVFGWQVGASKLLDEPTP